MRQLYCATYLKRNGKNWNSNFEYLHAESTGEANIKFRAGNSTDIIKGLMKNIMVAPVVGYQQDDRTGQIYV
jgi:hypothetical protein